MDMVLEGADPQARISTEGRSHDYTNYYNRGVLDVHHYSKITYHHVYPGIDWIIYTTPNGMKYDFIVHPGADPEKIRLRFEHHEELYLDGAGKLVHGNRLGRFFEHHPVSYQNNVEVPTTFKLEENVLSFDLCNYDRSKSLVIDPDRIWATYYGGAGNDKAVSCVTDNATNIYLAGWTGSSSDIAMEGHQLTFSGNSDAFLVKFTSDGVRLWSTYYGGPGSEIIHISSATDGEGNIYLAGKTSSETDIAYQGHQNTYGGGGAYGDAFLAKFDSNGIRLWATYYGGNGGDQAHSCAVDQDNNVFLAGSATSELAIASDGHQNIHGGLYDAFLVKFNSNGVRLWGSYYGGSDIDMGRSCAVDGNGNIYLAGETESITAIADGGHQNEYGGGSGIAYGGDAFLVKFNQMGLRLWATYYGGTADEYGNTCAVDELGNVYLAGVTSSIAAIASGGHQDVIGGGTDGFVVKFNSDGARSWGTYYGGSEDDEINSVCVSNYDIYVAGNTASAAGIAEAGFQDTFGGGSDAFLVKLTSNGIRLWGTYYGNTDGGMDIDEGFDCAVSNNSEVYLAGSTRSTFGIAYNGHQNIHGGGSSYEDGFLVKFEGGTATTLPNRQDQSISTNVLVFPNPASACCITVMFRDIALKGTNSVVIQLIDALGQLVHVEQATPSEGEVTHRLHLDNDFPTGLYKVVVTFGESRVQQSVVID